MANSTKRQRHLWDAYAFPGFRPLPTVSGVFGDPNARIITLVRRSKKTFVASAVELSRAGTTSERGWFAISRVAISAFIWRLRYVAYCAEVADG